MMETVGLAVGIVGGLSLCIGLLLGAAGRLFEVKADERESALREALPGNNCGACGYAGCDALAAALAAGEAPPDACPVGGAAVAAQVATILGVEASAGPRRVAFVACSGTCDRREQRYRYFGAADCRQAAVAPGYAGVGCAYGCFGFGSCAAVCPADAICVKDGVAVVTAERCIGCGRCVAVCPQRILAMRPDKRTAAVGCSSPEPGKAVKAVCSAGCIGCGLCQKACPVGAIRVKEHLARVDASLCVGCGVCVQKCPVQVIRLMKEAAPE